MKSCEEYEFPERLLIIPAESYPGKEAFLYGLVLNDARKRIVFQFTIY
jgi:hypothetical protein